MKTTYVVENVPYFYISTGVCPYGMLSIIIKESCDNSDLFLVKLLLRPLDRISVPRRSIKDKWIWSRPNFFITVFPGMACSGTFTFKLISGGKFHIWRTLGTEHIISALGMLFSKGTLVLFIKSTYLVP